MNILIVPEDFRKDELILKPIMSALAAQIHGSGRKRLRVEVCKTLLGGIGEALKWGRINDIIGQYPTVDMFLLCVDRDGQPGRRDALNRLEDSAREMLAPDRVLLGENAWQEIEVWILAGCDDLPQGWNWRTIRDEIDLKELYFDPYVQQKGLMDTTGGGRQILAREAARHYNRIRQLCREDILNLESRIKTWIGNN
jgi:hypothetical protein